MIDYHIVEIVKNEDKLIKQFSGNFSKRVLGLPLLHSERFTVQKGHEVREE